MFPLHFICLASTFVFCIIYIHFLFTSIKCSEVQQEIYVNQCIGFSKRNLIKGKSINTSCNIKIF